MTTHSLLAALPAIAVLLLAAPAPAQGPAPGPAPVPAAPQHSGPGIPASTIVAVVNGDVISRGDVDNRRRLFAISSGLPIAPDVLDRLTPQITRQLIDERLRLQEIQRRRIVVPDKDIADAIAEVEQRNGLPPGALRQRLAAAGIELRTLIDQIRVQIGWTQVLRQVLGAQAQITDADIAERTGELKAEQGQPEYRVSEIFVPITDPAQAEEARKFADTVIQELHAGAPFGVVAAQFSQSQTALQGGDLGWVQAQQLDPEVIRVVQEMPPGAISNPIRVPGGYSIVTLNAKRLVGNDPSTVLHVRQVFFPFTEKLNQQTPTAQQREALELARRTSANAKSCDEIEAANKAAGGARASDPGELRLEGVNPALRQVLSGLQPGKPSQPLVAEDGIAVVMLCSKEEKNLGVPTRDELAQRILSERIELASRQLLRDLQRRANIDQRS